MFSYEKYEIRLESIGGLGANLVGKLLGQLGAEYMELNAQSFASYGSEKRGSPVKAYIRYSNPDKEIRRNCPVEKPDLLGIFNISLGGEENVTAGVEEHTNIVVNTVLSPEETRDRLKLYAGNLWCIDALGISSKIGTRVNMVLLGAIAKASGFIPLEKVQQLVTDTLGKKYPKALEGNLKGIQEGFNSVEVSAFRADGKYPYIEFKENKRECGYENAVIGGINIMAGSTITNSLVGSREGKLPYFIVDKCIHCGLCDTTCPDMVFQFKDGKNLGMDLYHCKGCMRCVEICPTQALVEVAEGEKENQNIGNIHLINKSFEFDSTGANGYVESESYTVNSEE